MAMEQSGQEVFASKKSVSSLGRVERATDRLNSSIERLDDIINRAEDIRDKMFGSSVNGVGGGPTEVQSPSGGRIGDLNIQLDMLSEKVSTLASVVSELEDL